MINRFPASIFNPDLDEYLKILVLITKFYNVTFVLILLNDSWYVICRITVLTVRANDIVLRNKNTGYQTIKESLYTDDNDKSSELKLNPLHR